MGTENGGEDFCLGFPTIKHYLALSREKTLDPHSLEAN